MKAVIASCKCSKLKKLFGIRFESQENNIWIFNWAFPINERSAQHEGYDQVKINGKFTESLDYPGCPFCKAKGFFLCECGKLNCWNGKCNTVICGWCGSKGELSDGIVSIEITSDR